MSMYYPERRPLREFLMLVECDDIEDDITWQAYDFKRYRRHGLTLYAVRLARPDLHMSQLQGEDQIRARIAEIREANYSICTKLTTVLATRYLLEQWATWSDVCMGLKRQVPYRKGDS